VAISVDSNKTKGIPANRAIAANNNSNFSIKLKFLNGFLTYNYIPHI
jgi:hypothetical protein